MEKVLFAQVPQADKLSVLIDLVQKVQEGKVSDKELAQSASDRDGRYYRKAAINLGFISNEKNHAVITTIGSTFLGLELEEKKKFLIDCLTHDPFFRNFIVRFSGKGGFSKEEAMQFMKSIIIDEAADSTIDRRFQSVKSWLEDLDLLETKDRKYFLKNVWITAETLQEDEEQYAEESNTTPPEQLPDGGMTKPNKGARSRASAWLRKPARARIALENAKYACEIDGLHKTFTHRSKKTQYMEPHHLIPMEFQDDFDHDIDVPENIVSLCPTCHRLVHHASDNERLELLKGFYAKRKAKLLSRKIDLTEARLLEMYGVKGE